jgi:hypothetical protein
MLGCLLALAVGGCGGRNDPNRPELLEVSGTVTWNGKPLEGAVVVFEPQQGALSTGGTDAAGRFTLRYSRNLKGAVVGQHTVRISKFEGEAGPETIPGKYNENSALTCEVTPVGNNDFTFDLEG